MRTKDEIMADAKVVAKEISDLADTMGDCGGLQGAAVLYHHPELKKRLDDLSTEWIKAGYPTDMPPKP